MAIQKITPDLALKDEPKELDYADVHKKSTVDLNTKPTRPPLAISIGLDDKSYNGIHYPLRFGTFGNISMIKGEEKSRKTWAKSLILACAIGGTANLYAPDIKGHDLVGKYIIDIDTEQDAHDSWNTADRIRRAVGGIHSYYICVKLREYSAPQRIAYLEWLFTKSQYKDKLGIVSLDGYVDFLADFNSLTESMEFTQRLMKYTTMANCHITGVLHINPGTDKARGHLGTILQQKCETVLIVKDMGDYSEVICQRSRGKKFKTFGLNVNDERLPYVMQDYEPVKEDKPVKKTTTVEFTKP